MLRRLFFNTQLQITHYYLWWGRKRIKLTSTLSQDSLVVYVILLIWENLQIELCALGVSLISYDIVTGQQDTN